MTDVFRAKNAKAMQEYLAAMWEHGVHAVVAVNFTEVGFSVTWVSDRLLLSDEVTAATADKLRAELVSLFRQGEEIIAAEKKAGLQ
jgi:hypothetical protein